MHAPQVTPQTTPQVAELIKHVVGEVSREELQAALGLADRKSFHERYLRPALENGLIAMTLPNKQKAAIRLTKICDRVSEVHGVARFPVDVSELALGTAEVFKWSDPIAKVESVDIKGFDGALFANVARNRWMLLYNNGLASPDRIRFTQAHELVSRHELNVTDDHPLCVPIGDHWQMYKYTITLTPERDAAQGHARFTEVAQCPDPTQLR